MGSMAMVPSSISPGVITVQTTIPENISAFGLQSSRVTYDIVSRHCVIYNNMVLFKHSGKRFILSDLKKT